MANHNPMSTMQMGNATAAAPDQMKPATAMSLPTGGIKTVFHTGAPTPLSAMTQPPPNKKTKQTVTAPMIQYQQQQQPSHPGMAAPAAIDGQQLQSAGHPGLQQLIMSQQQVQQQYVQQQQQHAVQQHAVQQQVQQLQQGMQQAAAQNRGGVSLPVGVGIRLGGIGGIAPATAQSAPRAPGVQSQYNMWGNGTGVVTEQAVAERRQRNREHAKRSRVRKKFMLEALQEQVQKLQRENQGLRMMVQQEIPEHAMQIITECCSTNPLFADETENIETATGKKNQDLVRSDFSLMQSLATGQQCFVLSDPKLPDNPIVFASPGFYKLTGYSSKEVLGRNCRFLQGPGTDTRAVDVIRKAVAVGSDATVCLLNYKADGTPFWNQFFIGALRDSDNCIVNYVSCLVACLYCMGC